MPLIDLDAPAGELVDLDTYTPTVKPDQGDFGRGIKESFQQLPQMGYGLIAGAGAAAESALGEGGISTSIKNAGIKGYQEWGDKMAQNAKPSDSWNYSYDQAKEGNFGALVDWLQHGIGYVGGQAIQTLASGGIGAVGGKFVAGTAAKQIAEGMVAKEAANIAGTEAAKDLTAGAISKLATANVAAKFATIGQSVAVGANAFGMEGGEIFGDLTATNKGRALTGSEIGKAFAATLGAGALEFVGDKVGLDIMLGKSKLLKPTEFMPGMAGRAARGAVAAAGAAPIEAGTEYAQTLAEEYGKGNDPFSDASLAQARDAAALGALGGTAVGGAGGAMHGAKARPVVPVSKPDPIQTVMAAGTVDEAIAAAKTAVSAPVSAIEAGRTWQDIAPNQPADDLAIQRTLAQAGAYIQDLENIQSEREGAARSAARDASLASVGQAWRDLGISNPQDDLQAQRAGMRPIQDGEIDGVRPVPATISGERGPVNPESVGAGIVAQQRLGADTQGRGIGDLGQPGEHSGTVPAAPVNQPLVNLPDVKNQTPATSGTQTQTTAIEARAPVAGDAAGAAGIPAAGIAAKVQPEGIDQRLVAKSKQTATEQSTEPIPALGTEVSRYNGKFDKGMGKDAARLEAMRLNKTSPDKSVIYTAEEHNDPKLENPWSVVGRKVSEQKAPEAPVDKAHAATENIAPKPTKKPKGGQTLRATAYDRNPLLTFLATHGLYHDKDKPNSHKSEFSPDKGIMVMGYGPVFKKTGKRLDVLTHDAIEEGYLPKDGTEAQLRELIRRAVAGEKISPMYAEGVADNLAEQSYAEHLAQQQEAAQDEDFDPFQPLSDLEYDLEDAANAGYDSASDPIKLEVNALLALAEDQGIDTDAIKSDSANETYNDSEQAYYEAARNKLQAAIATGSGDSRSDAGSQGNADEQGSQEGLTAPTREDVLAQQDRAEQAEKDKAKADAEAERKSKAERERKDIAARQDSSAENFQLGQTAEESLSGQSSIFDAQNESNDNPSSKHRVAAAKQELGSLEPDTGSDIPPRYFKNVKVDHQVWIEDEGKSETHKVSAKDALASIKDDLENYKKLLHCMKG